MEPVQVNDKVEPREGIFMPYWNPGAYVVEVGTPEAWKNEKPKTEGGDWVIISSYGGWLPRSKFVKKK
jgi:hypothetical protein